MSDDKVVQLDAEKKKRELRDKLWTLADQGNWSDVVRIAQEEIAKNGGQSTPPIEIKELIGDAMSRVDRRTAGLDKPVPTPWRQLNETMGGGLWPGAHFLVAGTGVGKSQLSFQIALHAARMGIPVGLIALELDQMQMVVRLSAEQAGLEQWSHVYNGKAGESDIARVKKAAEEVGRMSIVTDFGRAMGWSASRLAHVVETMRDRHPSGPALVVLDFVQLIAAEEGKQIDLRERIGRAGYAARELAREKDVTVIIVSSTARENYKKLSQTMKELRLGKSPKHNGGFFRKVWAPDNLIGMGKESGELEYAADSVHVLLQPATPADCHEEITRTRLNGRVVVCATVKVRAGFPSWFALGFTKGRFHELCEDAQNSIAPTEDECRKTGRPEKDVNDYIGAVVKAVKAATDNNTPLSTIKGVREVTGGNNVKVREAIKTALEEGYIAHEDPYDSKSPYMFKRWPEPDPDDDTDPDDLITGPL